VGSIVDPVDLGKCTKLHVLSVERNAKSHSNRVATDQFTAETASRNVENQDSNRDSFE
jgi:hypothetical protein